MRKKTSFGSVIYQYSSFYFYRRGSLFPFNGAAIVSGLFGIAFPSLIARSKRHQKALLDPTLSSAGGGINAVSSSGSLKDKISLTKRPCDYYLQCIIQGTRGRGLVGDMRISTIQQHWERDVPLCRIHLLSNIHPLQLKKVFGHQNENNARKAINFHLNISLGLSHGCNVNFGSVAIQTC